MTVKTTMLSHLTHREGIREERRRRLALEADIETLSSAADRADFEALLDRYDDSVTMELHDILVRQVARAQHVTNRQWGSVGGM